jgi:transcription initiation factor TFIIIB Brf1 subunit/transcription initiation factor TFIIB
MTEKCPECQGSEFEIDNNTKEKTCRKCGLLIDEHVDLGKDFVEGEGGNDKKRRSGPPGKYLDGGSFGSTF